MAGIRGTGKGTDMGFAQWYDEHVVPRFIQCACSSPAIMKMREKVVPLAKGKVFEIGCGGGINQQFYDPAQVTSFSGMDPSAKGLDYAREAAAKKGWQADIRQGFGEAIPFDDDSFDCVVCTFTLCSVTDQAQTVRELRRILKPGGRLLYAEHGRAPDAGVRVRVAVDHSEADLPLELARAVFANPARFLDPEVAHLPNERQFSLDLVGLGCEIARRKRLLLL